MLKRFCAIGLFCIFLAAPLAAQPFDQTALTAWVDGVLAELRKAGAKDTSHGSLSYDPATGQFSLVDVKAQFVLKGENTDKADKADKADKKDKEATLVLSIARISAQKLTQNDSSSWHADSLHFENIRLRAESEEGALIVDSLDFDNIDAPQLTATQLGSQTGEQLVGLIQQASVKSVVLPRIALLKDEKKPEENRFQLGQIRIDDFSKGVAKQLTMAESVSEAMVPDEKKDKAAADKEVPVKIRLGAATVENLDIGLYGDLFLAKPKRAGQKDQLLYSKSEMTGASMSFGNELDFSIGPIVSRETRANVPARGIGALFQFVSRMEPKNEKEKAELDREMANLMKDWIALTSTAAMEAQDIKLRTNEGQFEFKRIAGKDLGKKIGSASLEGFSVATPAAKASVESINLKEIDTNTFSQAMFEEMANGKETPDFKNLEGKLPTFGLIEVNKINAQSAGEPPLLIERISFELPSWTKFMPNKLRLAADKVVIPASAFPEMESPNLKDLGYDKAELTSDATFTLDAKAKTVALRPFKFDFAEAGSVSSELALNNIDESMLGTDAIADPMSALGKAKFEKLSLRIDNGSFVDRYIAWKAKTEKKKPDEVRKELSASAKVITAIIPDQAEQKKAQEAIDAFFAKPKNLSLVITPKAPLSLLELQMGMMTDQQMILQKVNFAVTANQGLF